MSYRVLVLVWSLCSWGAQAVNEIPTDVKLVEGSSRCKGTAEVRHKGEWRRALTVGFWTLEDADGVCRVLDCGSAVSIKDNFNVLNSRNMWVVNPYCVKENATVGGCVSFGYEHYDGSLEVGCSDLVRLTSERSLCSGSLQIRDQSLSQSWTSVCEGDLGRRGAEVLCRELGCGAPLLQGELSPLGQMFHCEGHESALKDCPRNQTRTNPGTCSGPAVNLTCSEPVRLAGGASRCEGALEVKYRGEWRRAWPDESYPELWDLKDASAVCRALDCGSAVSTEMKRDFNLADVWPIEIACLKTASVKDCISHGFSHSPNGLAVVCSGQQGAPEDTESLA